MYISSLKFYYQLVVVNGHKDPFHIVFDLGGVAWAWLSSRSCRSSRSRRSIRNSRSRTILLLSTLGLLPPEMCTISISTSQKCGWRYCSGQDKHLLPLGQNVLIVLLRLKGGYNALNNIQLTKLKLNFLRSIDVRLLWLVNKMLYILVKKYIIRIWNTLGEEKLSKYLLAP